MLFMELKYTAHSYRKHFIPSLMYAQEHVHILFIHVPSMAPKGFITIMCKLQSDGKRSPPGEARETNKLLSGLC